MDIAKFAEIVNFLNSSLNPEGKIKIAMLADAYYESVKENYQLIEEI